MAVSGDDVRHIATLARLGLEPARIPALVEELNGILRHMDVLSAVDTAAVDREAEALPAMPLRPDSGDPLPLARPRESFAPEMRDGFFLVPRLGTHGGDAADDGA